MRMLGWTLGVAALLYVLACLGLYLVQRSLMYFPQPRQGSNADVIRLQVDGAQLEVTARVLETPHAVIYFGGNAEDVSASLPQLAATFAQHALYLLHYRGYGGSTGKPTEAALFADGLALFDKVRASHPNVTVIGRSLGSGVAVHVASARPVARLVLVTPYDSIAGVATRQFPIFPVRFLLSDRFESFRYAPKVTAPTTIITAEHDDLIPDWSSGQLLTRFAPGVARLVVIPSSGHNDLSAHQSYTAALAAP